MSQILLATDGSGSSDKAEQYVTKLYHPSRDSVLISSIAHVPGIVAGEMDHGTDAGETSELENVDEKFLNEAESNAENVAEKLRDEDFEVETIVKKGRPGPEICQIASENDVDVIMIGRRGQSDSDQPYLGSVSQYVVHNADCPVNVIPH